MSKKSTYERRGNTYAPTKTREAKEDLDKILKFLRQQTDGLQTLSQVMNKDLRHISLIVDAIRRKNNKNVRFNNHNIG